MKGLVVVICAPSQGGKDFIVRQTMQELEYFYGMKTSYATSYKIREPRKDDGEHIYCVNNENDIPVDEEDKITATVYGTQRLVYDKREIANKIENGEIVFIATASPELARKVKDEFKDCSITVFVKRQQVDSKTMMKEDLIRHEINPDFASDKDIEASFDRVKKRLSEYELMKPDMEAFVADRDNGADYIFKNWHTLIGGSWNTVIGEKSKKEFSSLCNFIMHVHQENERGCGHWRDKPFFDWFDEDDRTKNIFTMQDEMIKYLEDKIENE